MKKVRFACPLISVRFGFVIQNFFRFVSSFNSSGQFYRATNPNGVNKWLSQESLLRLSLVAMDRSIPTLASFAAYPDGSPDEATMGKYERQLLVQNEIW